MKKSPAPTADDYRRAAEIIGERGWNRGGYVNPANGSVCLLGAIYCARAERLGLKSAFDKDGDARRTIEFSIPENVQDAEFGDLAWAWNDDRGRTKREVTTKLRRLAKVSA